MTTVQTDKDKLIALLTKLAVAEEKLKFKLGHFRGVPHESASGELAYSELKVLEDYVNNLKEEIEALRNRLSDNDSSKKSREEK